MSLPFWKPIAQGPAQWWTRCDSCRWSGPMEKFTVWRLDDEHCFVCKHVWCMGSDQLPLELRKLGWEEVK